MLREILARVISNKEKIPRAAWNLVEPLMDDIKDFSDMISDLDMDKPETWLNTGVGVLQSFVDAPEGLRGQDVHKYCAKRGYRVVTSGYHWIMYMMVEELSLQVEEKFGDLVLCSVKEFDLLILIKESSTTPTLLWAPKDNPEKAWADFQDYIWKDRDCIRVSMSKDNHIALATWELTDRVYQGELLDTVLEMKGFVDEGIRRVVALQGLPGTGKSTLCANVARAMSKRTVVFENTLFGSIGKDIWDFLILSVGPQLLIVDDIDRVDRRVLSSCLSYFEDTDYKVPLTLMTTNDQKVLPDAFRRPGRIDAIYEVPRPSEDIRRRVIEELAAREGLEGMPDYIFTILDRIATNYPGAYLVEMIKRYRVYGWKYEVSENDLVLWPIWEEVIK